MIMRTLKDRVIKVPNPVQLSIGTDQEGWVFPEEVIENLRGMITRVSKKGDFPARLSMVAALRGDGVTYLSHALAATLANDLPGKVCLVDLNWWSSSTQVPSSAPGLAAVLSSEANIEEVILPTARHNLALLPAGKLSRQDRPVISRDPALKRLIDDVGTRFDHLILDIPAILATNDAIPLASLASACCMVIRQGVTRVADAQRALEEIDHLEILGVVLNQVHYSTPARLTRLISF